MSGSATVRLEEGEYALVVGQEGGRMSVRIEGAEVSEAGAEDLPVPAVLVAALAERLLQDPDFHDEMLDWYEEHVEDDDEDDDEEGGGEEGGDEGEEDPEEDEDEEEPGKATPEPGRNGGGTR